MANTTVYVYNYVERLGELAAPYIELHQDDIGIDKSTGHYLSDLNGDRWIWQNATAGYIGKIQYRKWLIDNNKNPLSKEFIEQGLSKYDIIFGNVVFWERSLYEDYKLVHGDKDLIEARKILEDLYKCGSKFDDYMNGNMMIICNIYMARKNIIFAYYEWLFKFLDEFCSRVDFVTGRNFYHQRAPGYIAERLLGFYFLEFNKDIYPAFTAHNFIEAANDKEKKIRFDYR